MPETEITCGLAELDPKMLKLIRVGDKEVVVDGELIGEITWIRKNQPYAYKVSFAPNIINPIGDSRLQRLPVKIRLKTELRGIGFFTRIFDWIWKPFHT